MPLRSTPFVPNEADAGGFPEKAGLYSTDLDTLVAGFDRFGVISGCVPTATGTNLTINVSSGVVVVDGQPVNFAGGSIAVATAHATLSRLDLVTIDGAGTMAITTGTAASVPIPPAYPFTKTLIAYALVPAAATVLTTANHVIDKRVSYRRNSQVFEVREYGAIPDKLFTDGVCTASNTTFTSASAGFTSADTGKSIYIRSAKYAKDASNAAVNTITFHTTITYVNPTTVTLAAAPEISRTGASGGFGSDNTAAFQAAIDACAAAGGGTVSVTGSYAVGNLVLKHRVILVGTGMLATILRLNNGTNDHMFENFQGDATFGGSAQGCGVSNMTLLGNRYNQSGTSTGIYLRQTPMFPINTPRDDQEYDPKYLINRVWAREFLTNGFDVDGRSSQAFIDTFAYDNANYGWFVGSDVMLLGGIIGHSGRTNVFVQGGAVTLIGVGSFYAGDYSSVALNQYDGFGFRTYLCNQGGVMMVGCSAQDNNHSGFSIDSSQAITMMGCEVEANSKLNIGDFPGVDLAAASYCTILGLVSTDRNPQLDGTARQQNAIRFRYASQYNRVSLIHTSAAGVATGAPIMSGGANDSLETNDIHINGMDSIVTVPAIANATTAPTLGQVAGGALAGRTRFVKYTWVHTAGFETTASTEASFAISANNLLTVTVPAFPTGVNAANIYVGATTGANKKQVAQINGATTTWTEPAAGYLTTGVAPPSTATLTPDPYKATTYAITLNANITIANPVYAHKNAQLRLITTQDATGGRVPAFGNLYAINWLPNTTAARREILELIFDGTNWVQQNTQPSLAYAAPTPATALTSATITNFDRQYTIPANRLKVGQVIRLTAAGIWTQGATGNSLTITLRGGSSAVTTFLASSAIPMPSTPGTNKAWRFECIMNIVALGLSGTMEVQGMGWFNSVGTGVVTLLPMASAALITINTTADNVLALAVTWSATTNSPSITMRRVVVEVVDQ
jgi:hypothetical protein